MRKLYCDRDLFGKTRRRRPKFASILENYDKHTFYGRLHRLQWLNEIFPKNISFLLDLELDYLLIEAKMTFIDGQFISTLLLCNSFIEHWLGGYLISKGYKEEAMRGMRAILDCVRKYRLLNDHLIDKIDEIRKLRNPFVHIKAYDHPDRLDRRIGRLRADPISILENDAKKAISLMYQIAITSLGKYKPLDK
jgi:hypothetical protein